MDLTLNPVQCFLCLPQRRTHKSGFCAVWRKTTTNSRCSSRTQGYPLCPIIQRSRFRFASVIRTGCTAARPTPIVPGFLCRSQHSCSPYSVSTSQSTPETTENSGFLCVFYFLLSSKVNSCRFQYRLGYKINADKHGASFYLGSKQFLHLCSRVKKKDLNSLPGKNTSFNSRCTSVSCTFYVSIFPAYKPKALPRKSNLNLL